MKLLFKISLGISFSLIVWANVYSITWMKNYGFGGNDAGYSVQQTKDGSYIVAGCIDTVEFWGANVWLIKTNSLGNIIWANVLYEGSDLDEAHSVQQTVDGGYIVAGFAGSCTVAANCGLLVKTDSLGDILWTKIYGDEISASSAFWCARQTFDGGYIAVGETNLLGYKGKSVAWLIKTDSLGDTLWTKKFRTVDDYNEGWWVEETSDSGYIITGCTVVDDSTSWDLWLIKTDSSGDTLWTKVYGKNGDDEGRCVQQTEDGGYIITGYTNSYSEGYDAWLVKTDSLGDTLWTKVIDNNNGECDIGYCGKQTTDGGYIVTGRTPGYGNVNLWLVKTDSIGDTLWTKTFGHDAIGWGVDVASDGGYIATGHEWVIPGGGNVLLIKTDSLGNVDTTGVEEDYRFKIIDSRLQIYPNPFVEQTVIRYSLFGNRDNVKLEIYDMVGRLVEERDMGLEDCRLKIEDCKIGEKLLPGIYFLKLREYKPIKIVKLR